jgi:predicted dehydrogenase
MVRTWINSVRPSIGKEPVASPPANLDFDLWAGPGRGDDYKRNLVHYHWHWRWEYGTGECGNNGIHALDVARGTLGVAVPHRVTCAGDKYYFDDDQETPDTQLATFEYPGLCIHWEHRTWTKRGIDGQDFGVTFYGTDGTLVYRSKGWEFLRGDKVVEKHEGSERDRAHIRNFLDCRMNRTRPAADIEEGHLSTQLCHLANIAWRTRSVVELDPSTAEIQHNPAAAALLGREYRKGYELPAV